MKEKILILLGSDSDFPVLKKGIEFLKKISLPFLIEVSSAHRTPDRTRNLIKEFEKNGGQIIIAIAGGAAHLPGVVASHTILPVLGIPAPSSLSGLDSLLSIAQMPGGIPVATFSIGEAGALNAVIFAAQILALSDAELQKAITRYRQEWEEIVVEKNKKLQLKIAEE